MFAECFVAETLPGLEVWMLQSDNLSHVNGCKPSETDSGGGTSTADFVVVLLMGSKDSEELDADYTATIMHNTTTTINNDNNDNNNNIVKK